MLEVGDRIELIYMDDPYPIPAGERGTVRWIEGIRLGGAGEFTQVSVDWDSGRTLMLSIPPDVVRKLDS